MSYLMPERLRFIEDFAELLMPWGMPLHAARLYGYLLLYNEPVGLDQIAQDLGIGKSKACVSGQLLEDTGNARRVKEPGSKRVFYVPSGEFSVPFVRQIALNDSMGNLLLERAASVVSGPAAARLEDMGKYCHGMRDAMQEGVRSLGELLKSVPAFPDNGIPARPEDNI
jgi:hypothetical protein